MTGRRGVIATPRPGTRISVLPELVLLFKTHGYRDPGAFSGPASGETFHRGGGRAKRRAAVAAISGIDAEA